MEALTPAWDVLEHHDTQRAYWESRSRMNVVVATRRGGKSVIGRRRRARNALYFHRATDGLITLCAPTREQAKRLHWEKTKALIPDKYIARRNGNVRKISEVDLSIEIEHNGCRLQVVGLDKPERAEGDTWDDCLLDEVADMKPSAWSLSVRPSLSSKGRLGSCDFIGKPRGRGFYYRLWQQAAKLPNWSRFHWTAADILSDEEIAAVKRELDEKQFAQEYMAEWVTFEGKCYYGFDEELHASTALEYDPALPLRLCFDFNVKPGTAVICQRQWPQYRYPHLPICFDREATCVLGEVWIPDNSNTPLVCERIIEDWGHHRGPVFCFGDPTGGNRGTAKVEGTDWDLIEKKLRPIFPDLRMRVHDGVKPEIARVNAMNERIMSTDGSCAFLVDPDHAPHVVQDFESVARLSDGRIDKSGDEMLTHLSDAVTYMEEYDHPITEHVVLDQELV